MEVKVETLSDDSDKIYWKVYFRNSRFLPWFLCIWRTFYDANEANRFINKMKYK